MTNNWPYGTVAYWRRTRYPNLVDFRQVSIDTQDEERGRAAA